MKENPRLPLQPTTHHCLQDVLAMAQILGVFPVQNIRDPDALKVKFTWRSGKIFYMLLLSFSYIFCATFAFHKALTIGMLLNQLITPLFYFHIFIISLSLTQLARRWPKFLAKWVKFEEHLLKKYKLESNLRKRINYGAIVMVLVALLEHTLATANNFYSSGCQNDATGLEYLLKKQFHFIFRYLPYHFIPGLILMICSWTATVVWSFGDMFIILISIVMTERYRQITKRIEKYTEENSLPIRSPESIGNFIKVYNTDFPKSDYKFWREIREDYDRMNQMVRHLDGILSNLVLTSYTGNLTFILIQLFNSLRQMETALEGFYFFYSFGFVIIRIVVVSIFGASINEESQAPLPFLNSLPTEIYNEEIQRLITQIHVDAATLTGHNFFRITKGLVLSVAATIITYELVLIQFNQATLDKYMTSNNNTICL